MPPSEASPSSALSSPASSFSSVLLPTPLAPTSPTCSPPETRNETSENSRSPPGCAYASRDTTTWAMMAIVAPLAGWALAQASSSESCSSKIAATSRRGRPRAAPRSAGGSAASSRAGSASGAGDGVPVRVRRPALDEERRRPRRPRAPRSPTRNPSRPSSTIHASSSERWSAARRSAGPVRPRIGPVGDHERLADDQAGSDG